MLQNANLAHQLMREGAMVGYDFVKIYKVPMNMDRVFIGIFKSLNIPIHRMMAAHTVSEVMSLNYNTGENIPGVEAVPDGLYALAGHNVVDQFDEVVLEMLLLDPVENEASQPLRIHRGGGVVTSIAAGQVIPPDVLTILRNDGFKFGPRIVAVLEDGQFQFSPNWAVDI